MKIQEIHLIISNKEKRNVKQAELAKILNLSREYISKLFRDNKELSTDKVEILEKHFNINLSEPIIEGEQVVRVIIPKEGKIKVIVEYE